MKKAAVFFLVLFLSSQNFLFAQDNDEKKAVKRQSIAERRKELAEKKERQKAEEQRQVEELKQMHIDNQDKKTRKRMKKAMKQANKNNTGKRGFSIRNWFSKKKRY